MKKLIIFSIGEWTEKLLSIDSLKRVDYFIDKDMDINKEGTWHGKPVYSPYKLLEENRDDVLIIIADSKYYNEISKQLNKMGLEENFHYYNGWNLPEKYFLNIKENNWQAYEVKDTFERQGWDERAFIMSSMIPEDVHSIVDFGCGNQRLKEYLREDIQYTGLDYVYRGQDSIVCDVNKDVLPEITADCAYMAGFLMYVKELKKFLSQIRTKYILFSYEGRQTYQLFGLFQNRGKIPCIENYKNLWDVIQIVLDNGYILMKTSGRNCETFCLFCIKD